MFSQGESVNQQIYEIVGGVPGTAGYQWDSVNKGWVQVWDVSSFVPANMKPEWNAYIPGEPTVIFNPDSVVTGISEPLPSTVTDTNKPMTQVKDMVAGLSLPAMILLAGVGFFMVKGKKSKKSKKR